jgi:hypothetical protein
MAAPPADRPKYTMDLALEPSRKIVTGDLTVEFTADIPTDRLVFRLWPNGPRQQGEGAELRTGDVTTPDGAKLTTELTDTTTLVVHPPAPLEAGDSITVSMQFTMLTPGRVLDRIATDGDQMRLGSFFPILAWQPGVGWALDPPTVSLAEASTSTTADFDVTIHAPEGSTVLASGVQDPDDPKHWTAEAVRDFAIAAGPFETATVTAHAPEAVKVTMGVQPGVGIPARDAANRAAHDLEALAALYGPYPWPELHVVITKDVGRAGIEYPTMIFEGAARFALTVSHEVGHQWFYSLVGDDQAREPWLDEALTTWAAANVSNYLDFMRSQVARTFEVNHVAYPMTFWDVHQDSYGTGVYWRGAQALDALGPPDAVNCALRRYVARNAYRIATTSDVIDAMTEVFPKAPAILGSFGIPAGN